MRTEGSTNSTRHSVQSMDRNSKALYRSPDSPAGSYTTNTPQDATPQPSPKNDESILGRQVPQAVVINVKPKEESSMKVDSTANKANEIATSHIQRVRQGPNVYCAALLLSILDLLFVGVSAGISKTIDKEDNTLKTGVIIGLSLAALANLVVFTCVYRK